VEAFVLERWNVVGDVWMGRTDSLREAAPSLKVTVRMLKVVVSSISVLLSPTSPSCF
jgi:hypothetical protein